jgi:hypothetical protein
VILFHVTYLVQCSTSPSATTVNTTIRVISRISLLLPLSVCAVHVVAIVLVPGAIGYLSENTATSLEGLTGHSGQADSEQRDTFVPQPNHLPLFTRGSGTR